jgi:excisionase family DNA binding protein
MEANTEREGFYTLTEFMRTYAVLRTSLYRAVKRNELRLTKLGRSSRISRADAHAWAERLPTVGGEA